MRKPKQRALEANGWRVASAADFLALTPEEAAVVELRLRLSDALCARRATLRLSQGAVADRLGSSQSRVAKMEAGDTSVSLDLLIRALVGLGATPDDVAQAIRVPKKRVTPVARPISRVDRSPRGRRAAESRYGRG